MATLESQGRVRQKTREFIKSPAIFGALKSLFLYLSIYKKLSDLAFLPLTSDGLTTSTTGQVVDTGASRIYAAFLRKANTATDTWVVIGDDATNIAGAAAAVVLKFSLKEANEEVFTIHPNGLPVSTGIAAFAATTATGTTPSSAADAPNGFVIVGA